MGIKKPGFSSQIIIAIALGVAWALFAKGSEEMVSFTTAWIQPFGKIFIKLLYLVAIPLVFSSLLSGIGNIRSIAELKTLGKHTLLLFLLTGAIATTLGLSIAYLINPGHKIDHMAVSDEASAKINTLQQAEQGQTVAGFIQNIVPDNVLDALSNNSMLLQVVVLSFLLGIALSKLPVDPRGKLLGLVEAIQLWFTELIHLIMLFAPIGVFALAASLDLNGEVLISLSLYMLTVLLGLAIMLFVIYPLFFTTLGKTRYKDFFTKSRPVLLMAFSTSSSNATLPLTLELVKNKFNIPENISNFVVSLGATVNMDGTALYQSIAVYFIAQSLGVDLSLGQMAIIVLTAIVSAVGAAGVPGAGMLTLLIILQAIGLPAESIVLILAPDRILDMFRTVINVAGDISTSLCVNGLAQREN